MIFVQYRKFSKGSRSVLWPKPRIPIFELITVGLGQLVPSKERRQISFANLRLPATYTIIIRVYSFKTEKAL